MSELLDRLRNALPGRYRVERQIGKGGMATVFLAHDLKHSRSVAIKVMNPEVGAAIGEERFKREIETVAGLAHPHILPLHDSGLADGLLFYVMPFVEGESLQQRLARRGPLTVRDALRFAAEIADALAFAHRHGIIHRDIKPGNILLKEGYALLADFGLARTRRISELTSDAETPAYLPETSPGQMVGTPTYMSPEQVEGVKNLDGQSDQYALGCVLFEMLAGVPPFDPRSEGGILRKHLTEPPPRLRMLRADVGVPLERAVLRALAKDPRDRFPDTSAFGAELRRLEREQSKPTTEVPLPGRRTVVLLVAVVLGVAAIAIVGTRLRHGWRDRSEPVLIRSVAVLPLSNLPAAPRQEYFSDGMAQELTSELGRIGTLKVISRASTATYKGTWKSPTQIGRELGVDGLITGTVDRQGARVRIHTKLVLTKTGYTVWSESHERELAELPALQREVTRAVISAVQARMGLGAGALPVRRPPSDPAAQEAYLQGLYHWNRRTAGDLRIAREQFSRATKLDTSFALAWVGLSNTYGLLPVYDSIGVDEAMPLARAAALKALTLDSTLAEAYASLGNIEKTWTFDWRAAESYYVQAIRLDPNYATAHHWYAVLLVWTDHLSKGLAEIELASQLDPRSPIIRVTLARICYLSRDYPRAAREYQNLIELEPGRSSAWRGLSGVYYQQRRIREASAAWERAMALLPDSLRIPSAPEVTTASRYLNRKLSTMLRLEGIHLVSPAELSAVHAELGNKDAAFRLLRSARMDELVLGDLRALPDYDSLRTDPRYRALEAEVVRRQSAGPGVPHVDDPSPSHPGAHAGAAGARPVAAGTP